MAVCHLTVIVVLIQTCTADLLPPDTPGQQNEGFLTHPYTKVHQHRTTASAGSDREGDAGREIGIKQCPSTCKCGLQDLSAGNWLLYVDHCQTDPLDELHALFEAYPRVTILRIASSHLSKLPSDIKISLPLVYSLYVEANGFQHVPNEVFTMTKLAGLYLEGNKIQELPPEISKLTLLQVLKMTGNDLESIPIEITRLSKLRRLILDHNQIAELPQGLSKMPKLDVIYLNFNQLKSLPGDLSRLPRLRDLQLSFNRLNVLPDDLWRCNILEHLDLRHNEIQTISCRVFNFLQLNYLDLSYNALKSLKCYIRYDMLGTVYLSHNHLEEIPCSLHLNQLVYLDMAYNEIQTFPSDCPLLSSSAQIKHIDISFSRITVLHKLAHCTATKSLEQLFVNNNNISTIDPGVFSNTSCLTPSKTLDLSNNILSVMDSWPLVLSMSRTITINISGNMLSRFTNSAGTHVPLRDYGSAIKMQRNQIRHFMDIFNGWNVSVNSRQHITMLLSSTVFDLGDNPLICDCVDYEIFQYIQTSGNLRYKETDLVCDKPMVLKGQHPGNISLERFVCDVIAKCPNGCICTDIPHITTLIVTCTNYSQTDIPTAIPDLPKESFAYHLDFSNQNLSMVTSRSYLWKAKEIILTNNSLQSISAWSSRIFQIVQKLYLDGNQLQTLPGSIITGITNQTASDIRLGNNPWFCDCTTMAMKDWIVSNSDIFTDQHLVICESPPSMAGTKVTDIERSFVCPNENKTAIYVVVVVAILLLIAMTYFAVAHILKYANWRLVGRDECDGEGKEFDVFVSYATEDEDYVEGFLIPELEKHDFRVCFHRVHFHGGKPILVNMSEAIEKSKRTLVFFSNNFKESPFGMFEFRLAHHLDVENNTRRLITIKDTDLDMDDLYISESHYFQTHTYIRREGIHFWRNLENTLPRMRLGAEVP